MLINSNYPDLFEQSFHSAPIGIALVAPTGEWIKVNKGICRLTGYSENELLQKTFQDITYEPDLHLDMQHVRDTLDGTIPGYSMEKRYITKKGNVVWAQLSVSLVRDAEDKPAFFISHVQDIQPQKELQAKLAADAQQFSNIIRAINDPLFVKDADHKWILVNEAFCSFVGRKEADLVGKSDYDFFSKQEADAFWRMDDEVLKSGKEIVVEEFLTDVNKKKHIIITKKCLYKNDDKERFIVGTFHDISEQKIREEELKQKNRELESMNAMMMGRELKMIELKNKLAGLENN